MTADKTGTKSTANSNSNIQEPTFCTPAVPTPTSFIFSDNEATEFSGIFSDSQLDTKPASNKRGRKSGPQKPASLTKKSKSFMTLQNNKQSLVTLTCEQWETSLNLITELKKEVRDLTIKVNSITSRLDNQMKADPTATPIPSLFTKLFDPSQKNPPSTIERQIISGISAHQLDTASREKNIVIMGAKDDANVTMPDEAAHKFVSKLLTTLKIKTDNIISCKRLKAISPHPFGIIKVSLKSKDVSMSVLKATKLLRAHREYDGVFVNPDLTYDQRANEKDMIKQRNLLNSKRSEEEKSRFHFGIRNGRVTQIFDKIDNLMALKITNQTVHPSSSSSNNVTETTTNASSRNLDSSNPILTNTSTVAALNDTEMAAAQ